MNPVHLPRILRAHLLSGLRQHARRTVYRDDRCSQGEQFLSEYSGSASQIYPRVTRLDMSCENRSEEMKPPRKSPPSITSGPAGGDLLVETRATRQPRRRGAGSLIQFTTVHCDHRRACPPTVPVIRWTAMTSFPTSCAPPLCGRRSHS